MAKDLTGIGQFGKAVNTLAQGAVDGASAFLSRVCLPAAEEFGLALQDQVRSWRMNNMVKILNRAEQKTIEQGLGENAKVDPRLMFKVYEEGSWVADDVVKDMWAGLLASSCSEDELDDSNLIFVNMLSELTSVEVRILNYVCEHSRKMCTAGGLVIAQDYMRIEREHLYKIAMVNDIHRLDRELDHLHSLDLTDGGFATPGDASFVSLIPMGLGLQLFVRAKGSGQSPMEFFKLQPGQNEPPFPHPYAMPADNDQP